ncbi:MarR family winged helix-turn-helix transcriptional regulator [Streptococcus sobrinus]|uniref:Transcriptional regulator, MarR family n=3 Tax=Streptococcus sobrinus TaxID=1310 RepID=U2J110_9STRE|nr:MarR family transcriptional regulator [Streptococcus sobrinus]AWN19606.1 MarR family transcriptional regulator [Streptococcus sobrinus]AWN21552.1 MarR family transcriptional regulator [Streptococcus sobrinus]AWN62337.1 MarR family transcriptional regulator [Streptococcus sobrinus]AWN64211.1 MarR family transcriptional regulator [Streptococcus sobrinus]EMP71957.1 MarR family transcriptional regulator [Streptococcus sobrinus DSM 20742 = ATCC 33478]
MDYKLVNEYLTKVFNNVLVIEEMSLKNSRFNDVSMKEMHTVDIIGHIPDATPSDIARELMVTLGTVTTSLNKLEKKGYVERHRSKVDRRVVHLNLTKKGRLIYRLHNRFHKNMVTRITEGMDEMEVKTLERGLHKLYQFLEELK